MAEDEKKKTKANADAKEEVMQEAKTDTTDTKEAPGKKAGEAGGANREDAKKPVAGDSKSDSASEAGAVLADADNAGAEAPKPATGRSRKAKAPVPVGIVHIKATFNNTMVSITDTKGGVIAWSSSGKAGFKGSRKSTAFAATLVGQDAARQAMARGMKEVEVRVQGAGSGRESAVRALQSAGLSVTVIKDITPVPHNGCRARKRRRV